MLLLLGPVLLMVLEVVGGGAPAACRLDPTLALPSTATELVFTVTLSVGTAAPGLLIELEPGMATDAPRTTELALLVGGGCVPGEVRGT